MKAIVKSLLTLVLVAAIGLVGCSSSSTGLTGSYQQDTALVVESMKAAVELPQGSPNQAEVRELARNRINDYTGRYRRDTKVAGSRSFTTMITAMNALAGYYTAAAATRPLPEKLKVRLQEEFDEVELALKRGV